MSKLKKLVLLSVVLFFITPIFVCLYSTLIFGNSLVDEQWFSAIVLAVFGVFLFTTLLVEMKWNGDGVEIMIDKVYVLTEDINDYNQHGEYFLGAFKNIPTFKEVNACDAYFGEIDKKQYKSLVKDGYLQNKPDYEFLYLREVELWNGQMN